MNTTKRESPLLSLLINIVIPVFVLSKFSTEQYLGPKIGLAVALSFPLLYGIWSFLKEKKANFISVVGFVSILLTGIIGIFEFPSEWIAYKEASIPFFIGLAVLISMRTKFPLVQKIVYNEQLMNMETINNRLNSPDAPSGAQSQVQRMLKIASYLVAASFGLSSILNFILAKLIIHSPSGTEAFAQEMGRMTALSYPVIALPSTIVLIIALIYVYKTLTRLTGLPFEKLFRQDL